MKKASNQAEGVNASLIKASPKRLFETLMEQTADRIYIKDEKSRFIAVSHQLASMHGFENRHDLEGMTDFDLFSIEHAQQAFDDEQEILKTGKPMINKVEKETWPDGSITWANSSKSPLYLLNGELVGIIGISRDITAEKETQEQLAEREKRLREQNAIMRADYESAKKVQSVMIPGRLPRVKNIELGYIWKPMTSVGGDILTFPRNPYDRLLFFLGDVCGHGVSAAFFTVLLKYFCAHAAEIYGDDPRGFLESVNNEISERIREGFVTGLVGHFSRPNEAGGRSLFLSHAGHRKVLVYRKKERRIEAVNLPPGIVMGIPGSEASETMEIPMQPGDRFYAYTDGIIEASAPNGDEFGTEALIQELERNQDLPVQMALRAVYKKVADFTEIPDQQDDITLVGFELTKP